MHDRTQEAWWAGLRSLSPRDHGWQHLIGQALTGPSIADTWLFYDHNHIVRWPPTGGWSEAASNRRYGYPAFIDSATTDLMLHFGYPCYCHALQHCHSRLGELLPSTAAQAWTSGKGWSVSEGAVGLLLDMAAFNEAAPEDERLNSLRQRRAYDVIAERLNKLRLNQTN